MNARSDLRRTIGQLNLALGGTYLYLRRARAAGGRPTTTWASRSITRIFTIARALVEITGRGIGAAPDPSLGTHFFQDLVEAQIYPLAVYLDDRATVYNHKFFYEAPDHLLEWIEVDEKVRPSLRLLKPGDYHPEHYLSVIMNDDMGQAIAFFKQE